MGGGDWDENVEQLADEMTKLSEAGVVPTNLDADEDDGEGDDDNAGE
ncbi:MAG: hypothetical protein IKO14_05705 [Oscillibacter sp.]|nr:hypothetical protein [Oscillibacter sp.]